MIGMKKGFNRSWLPTLVFALAAPVVTLNAQGRRGGGGEPAKPVPPPTSPVSGNAVSGKGLYYTYGCYACHGYNGETGARPFVGRWGNLATEQTFLTFLRGRVNVAPVTPSASMPNFSEGSLPDKAAKDIYAYIRTFHSSAPQDSPTLDAIVQAAKQDKK
jgi:mono/diheme cytochrome c family protein